MRRNSLILSSSPSSFSLWWSVICWALVLRSLFFVSCAWLVRMINSATYKVQRTKYQVQSSPKLLAGEIPALVDEIAGRRGEGFVARQSGEDVLQFVSSVLNDDFVLNPVLI